MTEFLRSHPYLTFSVSAILALLGGGFIFLSDPEDISGGAMILSFASFLAFCVGAVGIMILMFRPISFSKEDAASWELVRMNKKWSFVGTFMLFAIPVLAGVFLSTGPTFAFIIASLLFFGLAALGGLELWKYFERRHHAYVARDQNKDLNTSENKQLYEQRSKVPDREIQPREFSLSGREQKDDK